MLDEENLANALRELGYDRVKGRVYAFTKFEPDVEHYLYFRSWHIGQFFVLADF
jgi:hypothetical protein